MADNLCPVDAELFYLPVCSSAFLTPPWKHALVMHTHRLALMCWSLRSQQDKLLGWRLNMEKHQKWERQRLTYECLFFHPKEQEKYHEGLRWVAKFPAPAITAMWPSTVIWPSGPKVTYLLTDPAWCPLPDSWAQCHAAASVFQCLCAWGGSKLLLLKCSHSLTRPEYL